MAEQRIISENTAQFKKGDIAIQRVTEATFALKRYNPGGWSMQSALSEANVKEFLGANALTRVYTFSGPHAEIEGVYRRV